MKITQQDLVTCSQSLVYEKNCPKAHFGPLALVGQLKNKLFLTFFHVKVFYLFLQVLNIVYPSQSQKSCLFT